MGWWEDLFRPIHFGKPDEQKRKEVMNRGYGFSDKNQMGDLYQRSQYKPNSFQTYKTGEKKSTTPFRWPAGELSTQDNSRKFGGVPDDHYTAAKARMNPSLNPPLESLMPQEEQPMGPSLMEQILDRIDDPYGGFKGQVDTSALDAALQAQLSQIGQVRGRTNENYRTSDANLAGMFGAHEAAQLNQGNAAYKDIGADQLAALKGTREDAVGDLQRLKNEDNAKRMAMLKSLGIEAAAAQPTDTSAYDNAIANITQRGSAEETNAGEDQATNLAYNQTVANSIGQQGTQRRADLTQQLNSILDQLGMAETEANQRYGMTKAEMIERAKQQDYEMWNQNRQNDMSMYNNLFGQKMQLDDQAFRREQADREMFMQQQKMGMPQEVPGYGGLAEDLLNNYPEDQTQNAMRALSEVLSSDYLQGIPPEYDRTSVIARRLREDYQIDPVIASHLATNYGNLGNNKGFTPLPY